MATWTMNGAPGSGPASMPGGGVSFVAQFLSLQCAVIHSFTTPAGQAAGLPLFGPPTLVSAIGGSISSPAGITGTVSQPASLGN